LSICSISNKSST